MKNIIYLSFFIFNMAFISSCVKDNMEGPNAAFYGAAIDVKDGSYVEQDALNGSKIQAFEHGYENPTALTWDFKVNGEFRNNLVFANTYDLFLQNCNFLALELPDFVIEPGDNQYNFEVIPFLRILEPDIQWDQENNKIVATFKVEAGAEKIKIKKVALYGWSDMYVGEPFKYAIQGGGSTQSFSPSVWPGEKVFTLSIDLNANSSNFKSGRNYYFRIGALADARDMGNIKTNYAPYVKIRL